MIFRVFHNLPLYHVHFSSPARHNRAVPWQDKKGAAEDGAAPSPPSQSPPHLSSAGGSRSSARRAGTCEWSCRSESSSRGSCIGPRSRRCTCHPRSERGVGSRGGRKRPLEETDATASATRELPVMLARRQTQQILHV